jgi:hypothetical protein
MEVAAQEVIAVAAGVLLLIGFYVWLRPSRSDLAPFQEARFSPWILHLARLSDGATLVFAID